MEVDSITRLLKAVNAFILAKRYLGDNDRTRGDCSFDVCVVNL